MKVALWAEIRRLAEIEKLSGWAIARRLHCSRHTVAAALKLSQPPASAAARRASVLDPYLEQIKNLLAKYPELSAVRIREEIARGPQGYTGSACVLRRYLRKVRPARGRRLPGGALRTGPGDAGRLGRMRPRASWRDHAQGLGVRGRALL
jgi:transposase